MAFKTLIIIFHILHSFKLQSTKAQSWIRAGYWYYDTDLPTSDINSALFTHLICAFADLNSSSFELSIPFSAEQSFSTFTNNVKQKNPSITTLLSIEGGVANFSQMVNNSAHRKSFIDSSIKFARLYGFQGLDFSWPSVTTSSEMTNMGILFKEWRDAASSEPRNSSQTELLLTAAFPYTPEGYPVGSISSYLDWIHISAYEYQAPEEKNFTLAQAALFDPSSNFNTDCCNNIVVPEKSFSML